MAVRMGPWKRHFSTKEDDYPNVIPRTVPLFFNIAYLEALAESSRVQ